MVWLLYRRSTWSDGGIEARGAGTIAVLGMVV
jgi:hypothetical protein